MRMKIGFFDKVMAMVLLIGRIRDQRILEARRLRRKLKQLWARATNTELDDYAKNGAIFFERTYESVLVEAWTARRRCQEKLRNPRRW